MRITEILKAKNGPSLSFEMTRPKTEKGEANIGNVLDKIVALRPDFLTMTFGAGGLTADASMKMLHRILIERKQEVVAHLAGFGMSPEHLDRTVVGFKELGVENILVIRGDKPHDESFVPEDGSFSHASEILAHLKPNHDFCYGGSAYPESHMEAPDLEADLEYVKLKIANGAEFIICQYFYDNRFFYDFRDKARAAGITVPIIAGVMPIYSEKMMNILANLCGATITEEIKKGIAALPPDDKSALNEWGINQCTDQCSDLIRNGVEGLHFYTLNRSSSVTGIIKGLRERGYLA